MGDAVNNRRVLVIDSDSLLVSGVLSLLREHSGIELTTVNENETELHRQIREAVPQVVITEVERAGEEEGLSITRFLRENPRSTLIVLRPDQLIIEVFRARRVVKEASLDSLLSIIEGAAKRRPNIRAQKAPAMD